MVVAKNITAGQMNESRKEVTKLTTTELAQAVLNNPGVVFGFTTILPSVDADQRRIAAPHPYYSIVSVRLTDVQIVYINRDIVGGGALYTFEIPSYDWNLCAEDQDEDCLDEIIRGLKVFNARYGECPDTWFTTNDTGMIEIIYSEDV